MLKPTAIIKQTTDYEGKPTINVSIVWSGATLDRPTSGGFGLKPTHLALAKRLAKAIDAGVVYLNPTVRTDVNGQTYVSSSCCVLGRTLNADLKRLGF